VVVEQLELSNQLLKRVLILLLILRTFVVELLIDLIEQRMKFQIEMFKPLKQLYLFNFGSPFQLLVSEIEQNGSGLADGSFRGQQNKRVVFFGYFLSVELFVQEEGSHLDLLEVEVIGFGEI